MAPPAAAPLPVRARAVLELRRRREAAAEVEQERAAAVRKAGIPVRSFRQFVEARNPGLLGFAHVPRLVEVGERIITGELPRVLVLLPPRYFKSEIFSRLLTAAFLERHPTLWAGLASYGADLAWELSEEARLHFRGSGGQLKADSTAKKRWRTAELGGMWATGVGGPMLGRGYHLGVVDDPQDPEKAHSPTYQKRFADWWPGKFLSRQEPGARIVVVMQRLGPDDAIDFILRREVGEDTDLAPQHWHVVVCDEIRDDAPLGRWDGPRGLPSTCTIEEDPRELGTVLARTRFNPAEVTQLQRSAGTYVTAAQRQQRPSAPTGDFWQESWFQVYDELPAHAYNRGRDWDTAYTKEEVNSASANIETYRGAGQDDEFPIYVHDVDWDWVEFPELVKLIQAARGPHFIEKKASGKSAAQALRREKVQVSEVPVKGDKLARAAAVQTVVSDRRVWVRRKILRRLLLGDRQGLLRVRSEQLAQGRGDLDLNDVFVQALHRHVAGRRRRKIVSTSSVNP